MEACSWFNQRLCSLQNFVILPIEADIHHSSGHVITLEPVSLHGQPMEPRNTSATLIGLGEHFRSFRLAIQLFRSASACLCPNHHGKHQFCHDKIPSIFLTDNNIDGLLPMVAKTRRSRFWHDSTPVVTFSTNFLLMKWQKSPEPSSLSRKLKRPSG